MKRFVAFCMILALLCGLCAFAEENISVQVIDCRKDPSLSTFEEGAELMEIRFPQVYGTNGAVVRVGDTVIVIDACMYAQYDQMKKLIDKMGITKIDYCINTHPDNDHVCGFFKILREYEVGCVITGFPRKDPREDYQQKLLDLCEEVNVPWKRYEDGDVLELGDLRLEFIQRFNPNDGGINNSSLIIRLDYKGRTALFPGDIQRVTQLLLGPAESESNITAEFINWPHHGYNNMQTSFIDRVDAKIYLITSGPADAKTAVQQLRDTGRSSYYYYTDSHRMSFLTDGDHWEVFSD